MLSSNELVSGAATSEMGGMPSSPWTLRALQRHSRLARLLVRGPEGEVVPEQLHDEGGILVRVLCHVVQLRDRVLEGGARHLARFVRVGQHLVLEHGVVQRQAQANRVSYGKVLLGNAGGLSV